MKIARTFSRPTLDAAKQLGERIVLGRRERAWNIQELAERLGASRATVRKIERGDPTVEMGLAFEAAILTGVALLGSDTPEGAIDSERVRLRTALLPKHIYPMTEDDDGAF